MHSTGKALAVIEFIEMLNLTGDFYGQQFKLMDWQKEIIWNIYGTLNDKGTRQYQFAYLEIPKKNGKTELTAALSLYHLVNDPPSGQIYCCAAEREQASLVYKAAIQMIEQNEDIEEMLSVVDSKKQIFFKDKSSFIKVLSAEAYSKHGLNPTVVIFDELHAQPNRNLWDVMTFGAGAARKEPLWIVITTAGDDPDRTSIGWEIHEYARRILDKEIEDPIWYAKIYGCPDEADIYDEKNWYAANPSLGLTIEIDRIRQEATTAKNNPSMEKLFRWLRLNQWVALKEIGWLPLTLWDATVKEINKSELAGMKCYAGLDLSSTQDLTGLTLLFPPQDGLETWYAIFEAWIPAENMKKRVMQDKVPYDRWTNEKYLHATPGNAVDYDFVQATIEQAAAKYELVLLATDPWNSRMLTQQLMKKDIEIIEVSQTMAGLSPAMKHIEKLLLTDDLLHEKNPLARWCFGNLNIAIDGNENIKPMKNKSIERIDVIVSLINAMAIAMGHEMESIYESRGLVVI